MVHLTSLNKMLFISSNFPRWHNLGCDARRVPNYAKRTDHGVGAKYLENDPVDRCRFERSETWIGCNPIADWAHCKNCGAFAPQVVYLFTLSLDDPFGFPRTNVSPSISTV